MKVVAFKGEIRTDLGKKATKAIRYEEKIPAVLYGGDDTVHFTVTYKDVKPLVFTPDFKIAEVEIDGKTYRCILKDIQWHPVSDEIQHIDFLRLIDGHPIKVEVPIRFTGSAPGVRAGGKLQQAVRRIKIKTTPEKMVDIVDLDISKLEMGQSIRVRDIAAIDGVEVLAQPGTPVASVEIPRALRSAATAAAKEAKSGAAAPAAGNED
jgi:large subunit ribosomal protein L25